MVRIAMVVAFALSPMGSAFAQVIVRPPPVPDIVVIAPPPPPPPVLAPDIVRPIPICTDQDRANGRC